MTKGPSATNLIRFTAFSFAGGCFGTVVSMPASSYLCESRLGWPSVFYLFGGLGVLWFVAWALLVHDGPDVHPSISPQEKQFLQVTGDTP